MSKKNKDAKREAREAYNSEFGTSIIDEGQTNDEAIADASETAEEMLREAGFKKKKIDKILDKWNDKSSSDYQDIPADPEESIVGGYVRSATVGSWSRTYTHYEYYANTNDTYIDGTRDIDTISYGSGAVPSSRVTQNGIWAYRDFSTGEWNATEYNNMVSVFSPKSRSYVKTLNGSKSTYTADAGYQFFDPENVVKRGYKTEQFDYRISGKINKNGYLSVDEAYNGEEKLEIADKEVAELIKGAFTDQMFNKTFNVTDKGIQIKDYVAPKKR